MRKQAFAPLVLTLALAGCSNHDTPAVPSQGIVSLTCSVTPTSGPAPLRVFVTVQVQGSASALTVNYGDGTTSTDPDAGHYYFKAGAFALSVTAANGGTQCSQNITVTAAPALPPNKPPVPVFKITPSPATGTAPLTVEFNMCLTSDPDGDRPLEFSFDVGQGAGLQVGLCRKTHTYQSPGTFKAQDCVNDGDPTHQVCQSYTVTVK